VTYIELRFRQLCPCAGRIEVACMQGWLRKWLAEVMSIFHRAYGWLEERIAWRSLTRR